MITLSQLVPLNLEEEKQRFLAAAGNYNPQFRYEHQIDPQELTTLGLPQADYLPAAQWVVEHGQAKRLAQAEIQAQSQPLSQAEVTRQVQTFLRLHGLEDRYSVVWSSSFVARTSINASTIKLRLPAAYYSFEELLGVLYHEIGTHALRRLNYEQQPWFKKKKKFGFASYLETEEGLATFHFLLPQSDKLAFGSALRYLAVAQAQKSSFQETYQFINQYVPDFDRCWSITFKQKRGLTDTSRPGGFSKGQVYFSGMIEVWNYLIEHDFNPEGLYWGKLAAGDVEKAQVLNPDFEPLLPIFYTKNQAEYRRKVMEIGQINGFTGSKTPQFL